MPQDTPLNEKESFMIIEQMISSVKRDFREDSFLFILWGWLVLIASLSHYALLVFVKYPEHYLPWSILMPLGGIASAIYSVKKNKEQKVKTYLDNFMQYLWTAFLVSLFIVLFFMNKIGYWSVNCLIMMIYGIGTYVTGGALKFKPLIYGGIICWALAVIGFLVSYEIQLLLLALSTLCSYLIPGYLLKYKSH